MSKVKLLTGLGYVADKDGHITGKFDLPIGEHTFFDVQVIEVANRTELDAVEVWVDPVIIEEQLIQDEIDREKRVSAIKSLKGKGKLRLDYKEE